MGRRVRVPCLDVPWLDGRDFSSRPLDERRATLNALRFAPPLYHVDEVTGAEPWTHACGEGWEGVIAKRRDSPYEPRRSKHWLKMKYAYAVRPKPHAPVSAPCTWEEVERGVAAPQTFTLRTMDARLDVVGDLWAELRAAPCSLPALG